MTIFDYYDMSPPQDLHIRTLEMIGRSVRRETTRVHLNGQFVAQDLEPYQYRLFDHDSNKKLFFSVHEYNASGINFEEDINLVG